MPRGYQNIQRCGKGYCPAAVRIAWGEVDWRLPIAAKAIGKGITTLLRCAEKLNLPGRPRQRKPPVISKARLKDMWSHEKTPLARIADEVGISVDSLQYRSRVFGFGKRKCGRKVKWKPCLWFDEMWRFGVSTKEMAKHIGCSQSAVSNMAASRGLALRYGFRGRGKTVAQFNEHGIIISVRAKSEREAA